MRSTSPQTSFIVLSSRKHSSIFLTFERRRERSTEYWRQGGVLLATVPGISQTGPDEWEASWFWRFTPVSARRLLEEVFAADSVKVKTYGNVLAACAFLQGWVTEELRKNELNYSDPYYDVTIAIRAAKPKGIL